MTTGFGEEVDGKYQTLGIKTYTWTEQKYVGTNQTSQHLSEWAKAFEQTADLATGVGLTLVIAAPFTEGATLPAGAVSLTAATYAQTVSLGLRGTNYILYGVGDLNELVLEGAGLMTGLFLAQKAEKILDAFNAGYNTRAANEMLWYGYGTLFTPNISNSQSGMRPYTPFQYANPDATSTQYPRWP